jgi:hypothetical protein
VTRCLYRRRNRQGALLLTTLTILATLAAVNETAAAWRVTLDGADVTAAAAPIESGGTVAVNIGALGMLLGMEAIVTGGRLSLTDSRRIEWTATDRATILTSSAGSVPLRAPLLLLGSAVYLPIESVSELSGLRLEIDRASQRADLFSDHGEKAECGDGWTSFTMPKPPDRQEKAGVLMGAGQKRDFSLPCGEDRLRIGLGVGYVQNTDWAQDLVATGKYRGLDVDLGARLTMGQLGVRPAYGRMVVANRGAAGWQSEAGNLYSDLRGLANGVRYIWLERGRRQPYVSLYLKTPITGAAVTTLAYGDEVRFGSTFALGGEVAADASYFLKGRFRAGHFLAYGFSRSTTSTLASGSGAFASFELTKDWSVYGTFNRSGTGIDFVDYRSVGLRFPLPYNISAFAEYVRPSSPTSTNDIVAVTVARPFGPVSLLARMQTGRTSFTPSGPSFQLASYTSRQLMTSVAYFMDPKLSFNFQSTTAWQDTGGKQDWNQLVTTYQISQRTQFQAINNFPQLFDPNDLRLRLSQYVAKNYSLILDYGLLQPFQGIAVPPGDRGLMLMVRRELDVSSPARGGRIEGRVADAFANPLQGAVVQLGDYSYVTDDRGRYQFRAVPPGTYRLSVDEGRLPADYKSDGPPREIVVANSSRLNVDLKIVPLRSICGLVALIKDVDGRRTMESLPGIVLRLENAATATLADGSFGFYNLETGSYTIALDKDRLPPDYIPASPTEVVADLKPDSPTTGIQFLLVKREKPIRFQPIEK